MKRGLLTTRHFGNFWATLSFHIDDSCPAPEIHYSDGSFKPFNS